MESRSYIHTLLHFNLEFVAGERHTYDKLLNEAFEPALDVFSECPDWHADIELSGLMLEFMESEFPWMIDKLVKLNKRGQIDVICVHYSETIWPAFPLEDFRRSWNIDRKIMERLGLRFSPTFFAQENFFGEGLASVMNEFGFRNATIPEKNYTWPFGNLGKLYPVYDMNGMNVILRDRKEREEGWWVYIHKSGDGNPIKIRWKYDKCGDGEPWVGGDPYKDFWKNPDKINAKLELYDKSRAEGVKFVTTDEFVKEMESLGVEKPKIKPVPDGPWDLKKPGIFQWMGLYFSFYELDVEMRSLQYRSRSMLLAAESMIKIADKKGIETEKYRRMLERGWKKQINAEVSDSTGWVPSLPEMYYGIDNALMAFYWGEKICRELAAELDVNREKYAVDTLNNVLIDKSTPEYPAPKPDNDSARLENLIDKTGAEFFGPDQRLTCYTVDFGRLGETSVIGFDFNHMDVNCGVKFRIKNAVLRYSPALMDNTVVDRPFEFYSSECTHLFFPLPNGLIGLDDNLWVIKQNDCTHVACRVNFPENKAEFMMMHSIGSLGAREDLELEIRHRWRFHIFEGPAEKAVKLANRININPVVPLDYPLWEKDKDEPYPWIPFTRMVA